MGYLQHGAERGGCRRPRGTCRGSPLPTPHRPGEPTERRRYLEVSCGGCNPEIVSRDLLLRDDWYDNHTDTVIRCDLFEIPDIRCKAA